MNRTARVAIVDDDEGVRTSLSSLTRSLGYEVRTYGSAVDLLSSIDGNLHDCLITDIRMPRINGDELLSILRDRGFGLPVIVMTAFPSEATRERVVADGAFAYLTKPVDGPTLARCIARAIAGAPDGVPGA